jgi:CheY-like chemotaxis protein
MSPAPQQPPASSTGDSRLDELRYALAEAQRRLQAAEQASEAKSRFIAHLSHEIRTPLNGVLGLSELALKAAESPSQRRHLEMALASGHALLQLVNDLLDFSRIEAGRMPLQDEPFNLPDALASVFRAVIAPLRGKEVVLRFDHVGDVTWVRGDEVRLRQIVGNLLGNAVKFTQRGELALLTETTPLGNDRCLATIRVLDTGPGLSPEMQARLFSPYEQAGGEHGRQHGAGLGLSIARGLARAMGGDITVQSTPGKGSVFSVSLPFATAPDPDPVPEPPPGMAWLVFPQGQIAGWIQSRLQRLQWRSVPFDSLQAVIAAAPSEPAPQLLMISERGVGADADFAALRAALPDTRIHLIVRPDWNAPELERAARAQDVHLTLSPMTPQDLMRVTSAAATDHPPMPQPAEAGRAPPPPAGDVLIVEDNPVNRLIGEEFLKALGIPVRVVDSGEAALRACLAQPPQLVLMDVQMPGMDGRETCRRLRELQQAGALPDFPIVALTAHAANAERDECLAAGMDGYLSKPLMLDTLKEELEHWVPTGWGA